MTVRYLSFFIAIMCAVPMLAFAYGPTFVETPRQNEVMPLREPKIAKDFYGRLEGYPHMYEFATKEPIRLAVGISVPDNESSRDNVSGIVLFVNKNGSVREVARLRAREASWESYYEIWGGDSYRKGGSFETNLEPGTYRIEVSTPDNIGTYVLHVGTEKAFPLFNYFSYLGKVAEVKMFFGKSPIRIVESPLVYGPVLISAFALMAFFIRQRRKAGVQ